MNYTARIDLGLEQDFVLGELSVRPSLRQVADRTGRSEVVEPRVMQVLVALARANGEILTREALTVLCWDGRVVGEDAINRVMSRLRRLSEGAGRSSFRIETITKVGYRLVAGDAAVAEPSPNISSLPNDPEPTAPAVRPTRRFLLGAGLLASLATIGTYTVLRGRNSDHVPSPEVIRLMELGQAAMCKSNAEGMSEAIGHFRRATELDPEAADAWGRLSIAYAYALRETAIDTIESLELRTRSTADHAFALEPHNPFAEEAIYTLIPNRGHWMEADSSYRAALRRHPDSGYLIFGYGRRLAATGRMREAASQFDRALGFFSPSPGLLFNQIWSVWASSAIDEADRAVERAYALFPLHVWIWFTRFYILMFSGRAHEAIAMGENVEGRPPLVRPENFELPMASARALDSRAPEDIERAMRMNLAAARRASGHAENAMQFASAIGRLDQAFETAGAYFFNRGYVIPNARFDGPRQVVISLSERRTTSLFLPPTEAMRRDPRFSALAGELGLTQFWRESGVSPDYQRV